MFAGGLRHALARFDLPHGLEFKVFGELATLEVRTWVLSFCKDTTLTGCLIYGVQSTCTSVSLARLGRNSILFNPS